MHYIIDGYNFLFRFRDKYPSLEKNRKQLIDLLSEELFFLKGSCSIVFDSSEATKDYAQTTSHGQLEVIYAPKNLSADEYIVELVENSPAPKTKIIVTSDSGLGAQCKHLGAVVTSIEEFVLLIMKKTRKKDDTKPILKESQPEIERLLKIFEGKLKKRKWY